MPPLESNAVELLLRYEIGKHAEDIALADARAIVASAKGNPEGIIRVFREWVIGAKSRHYVTQCDQVHSCIRLLGNQFVPYADIKRLWQWLDCDVPLPSIEELEHSALVDVLWSEQGAHIRLQDQLRTKENSRLVTDTMINKLASLALADSVMVLRIAHHLLTWETAVSAQWMQIIGILIQQSRFLAQDPLWPQFLAQLREMNKAVIEPLIASVYLFSAEIARREHNPDAARNFLAQVKLPHSAPCWIDYQLELIACDATEGRYERAFAALRLLEREIAAKTGCRGDVVDRYVLLRSQIHLDLFDPDAMTQLVHRFREKLSPHVIVLLQMELLLFGGKSQPGDVRFGDMPREGKLYEYYLEGVRLSSLSPREAIHYWLTASQIASRSQPSDMLIVGRCLCNVGASYIHLGEIESAKMYLVQAQKIQERIHDAIGLLYTAKNMQYL